MTMTIAEELDRAIEETGGDVRHALNLMMADRDIANALLVKEKEKSVALIVELKVIRALIWPPGPVTSTERVIDKIACEALRVAGQTATSTTEED